MSKLDAVIINILHSDIEVPAKRLVFEVVGAYGIALSETQIEKIQIFIGLLLLWNQKLSLTTITDHREILGRHFGESFFASRIIDFGSSRLADVGSGAGFPSLALKIISPELQVFLIEQHTKKCVFLNEAIRLLDMSDARVIRSAYEVLPPEQANFDFIAARALGNHKNVLNWAQSRLGPDGRVALWLGSGDAAKIMTLSDWNWDQPHPIPNTRNNVILTGKHS
jgi:16S rRNA (guanine527-N7)-methyltransferase